MNARWMDDCNALGDSVHRWDQTCCDRPDTNCRPVAVIDPEDRAQVERIQYVYATTAAVNRADAMQAALRSLVAPPRPLCSAHGNETCTLCSRITLDNLADDGNCRHCSVYATDGMHWDTCPARIRGDVYPNRDAAMGVRA